MLLLSLLSWLLPFTLIHTSHLFISILLLISTHRRSVNHGNNDINNNNNNDDEKIQIKKK